MSDDDKTVISIVDASKGRVEEHDTFIVTHTTMAKGPNVAVFTNRDKGVGSGKYNEPVCVNPRHILAVYPANSKQEHPYTAIQMITGEWVYVKEDLQTVVGRLNSDYK